MIVGTLGGLIAAWFVLQLIYESSFLVQVASFVGSSSELVGQLLFYLIGAAVGLLFGLLFDRKISGSGPALIWGLNYGIIWWLFGSLTLIPWLAAGGLPQNWPRNISLDDLLSLSALILYAIVLSLFYFIANKVWQFLFIDSDPLNSSQEGIGIRGVRNILMGMGAGLIGGLFSSILMLSIGGFTHLAILLKADSELTGLLTYFVISTLIGLLYGLLFQRQATSYGTSIAWGLTYGLLWWYLGTNTLVDTIYSLANPSTGPSPPS